VDITVYLPDELGSWAKDNKLNFSATLRAAVEDERKQRAALATALEDASSYDLRIEEHATGKSYTARLHGTQIAGELGNDTSVVFLGKDELIYVYDTDKSRLYEGVQVSDLRKWLTRDADYARAMIALGEPVVIDVGLPS
jgi:hypothetical protein